MKSLERDHFCLFYSSNLQCTLCTLNRYISSHKSVKSVLLMNYMNFSLTAKIFMYLIFFGDYGFLNFFVCGHFTSSTFLPHVFSNGSSKLEAKP